MEHAEEMMHAPAAADAYGVTFGIDGFADGRKTSTDVIYYADRGIYSFTVRDAATKDVLYGEQFERRGTRIEIQPIPRLIAGLVLEAA
jgi:hypothetical protein